VPRKAYALLEDGIVREFHRLYYNSGSRTWSNTFWLGTPAREKFFLTFNPGGYLQRRTPTAGLDP
jgi:hypothetical protein